jgi:competence protein ComEC
VSRGLRVTAAVLALLIACAAWGWALWPRPRLTVTFLDVGQGDAIVVRTAGGGVLLVDAGGRPPDGEDMGRRVVVPFLRSQGVNRIDGLLLTHGDEDHAGGALSVMERLDVRRILVPDAPQQGETFDRVLAEAARRRIPVARLSRGLRLDWSDGAAAEVVNPAGTAAPTESENDASVVLRLRYGVTSLLLTGDAEAEAEARMAAAGGIEADVLKLAHHGSKTSTTERFLEAVRPRAAIISCGKRNRFGHPHPDVTERLERRGVRVFRTDRDGAVTVESDGRELRIYTSLSGR